MGGWAFFAEENTNKKGGGPKQLSMDTLFKAGCTACPLNKVKSIRSPKMPATGAKKPLLYLLGEAPGEDEDKEGRQFVGKAGQLLRKYVPKDFLRDIRWNNSINCHPGKGNPNPTAVQLACCRPRIVEDIEKTKPKAIVGFGNFGLKWVIDEDKITKWRGHRMPIRIGKHTCWFYPTFHPSYLARNQRKHPKSGRLLPSDQELFFERDMDRILEEIDDLPEARVPDEEEIRNLEHSEIIDSSGGWADVKQIKKRLKYFGRQELVSFDYETASDEPPDRERKTRPYGKNARILSVAVSNGHETLTFPFRHREAQWTQGQLRQIEEAWVEFLHSKAEKIAQNLFFELEWSIYFWGLDVARSSEWHDTMAQAYVLGHQSGTTGLDALTLINFGFRLKNYNNLNMNDLDNEPLDKVLEYNAMDAKWEFELFLVQEAKVNDEGLEVSYDDQIRRTPTLAIKSYFGMLIDFDAVLDFDEDYSPRLIRLEDWFGRTKSAEKYEKEIGRKFKPSSARDVTDMLVKVLGRDECKVEIRDRDGKLQRIRYSTEDKILEQIPLRIAGKLQEYRGVRGNKSKYIDPLVPKGHIPEYSSGKKGALGKCIWPDGLTHAKIEHQFLVTRRTSCSFPNEQFWPKRDEAFMPLRGLFTAPNRKLLRRIEKEYGYELPSHISNEDCYFVAIDYGQIQARIAGMVSKDRVYCTYLWDRNDIHMRWTKELARAYPDRIGGRKFLKDKDALKKFRTDVKNQWTFPLIFGATARSVSGYLNIPEHILLELIEMFFDEMPGLKKWQKKTREFYDQHGYVEGPTGWRRYGPIDHGEVINTPIQNGEVEIVLDAMTRLSEAAQENDEWQFQARLEVHDELGFWIPKKTVDRDLEFIADQMLECKHFDWINVPLCIEISQGPNWHQQKEGSVIFSDDLGKLNREACGF